MKKHVRDRVSLAAAVVLVAAVVTVALVATTTSGENDASPGTDLVLPTATAVPTALPAPALLGSPKPLDPGPPQRPRPGTYRYRITPPYVKDPDTTRVLRITNNGSAGQTETLDGELIVQTAWRADGKYSLQHQFGQQGGVTCDWEPDIRELVFPLKAGKWSSRASCNPFEGLVIEREVTSEITGAAQLIIGGQDTLVWVIRTQAHQVFRSGQEVIEQDETSRSHFSPKHGLMVRITQRRTGEDPVSRKEIDESATLELTSLDPS
ncbi:MAG TPA: hypothetical protein VNP73_01010 [Actinomycetota bacterium]|nr:hypothetical protein [Actinomycetota bacterium]